MDLPLGMLGHDQIHEIEELDAPAAAVMPGADIAAGNVEGCESEGCPFAARDRSRQTVRHSRGQRQNS